MSMFAIFGRYRRLAGVALLGALASCGVHNPDPLQFTPVPGALVMRGVIDDRSLPALEQALVENPGTRTLIFQSVPGSADDEANLHLARVVRARGLNTSIPAGGLVASGGTDLFLAGAHRQIAPGACVGVHAWSDWLGSGAEVARDDPVHQEYLSYYRQIGIPEGFYWYTMQAADADEMHWMRAEEMDRFAMTSRDAPVTGTALACEARSYQ